MRFTGNEDESQGSSKNDKKHNNNNNNKNNQHVLSENLLEHRPWWQRAIVCSGGIVFNILLGYVLYLSYFIQQGLLQHTSLVTLARATAVLVSETTRLLAAGVSRVFCNIFASILGTLVGLPLGVLRNVLSWLLMIAFKGPLSAAPPPPPPPGAISAMSKSIHNLAGPVHTIGSGSEMIASNGHAVLLYFGGMLSLNLGVFNALPLPILDGGQLLFLLWEGLTGRPVHSKVREGANLLATLLLLWLFGAVLVKDIRLLLAR